MSTVQTLNNCKLKLPLQLPPKDEDIDQLLQIYLEDMIKDAKIAAKLHINGYYRGEQGYSENNDFSEILSQTGWTMSWSRILGEDTRDENCSLPFVVKGRKIQHNIDVCPKIYEFASHFGNLYLCGLSKIRARGAVHLHADIRCEENEALTTDTATWNGKTEGGMPLKNSFPVTIMNIPLVLPENHNCHITTYDHNVEILEDHKHELGKWFAFDPRLLHKATNDSDDYRIVLVVYYVNGL